MKNKGKLIGMALFGILLLILIGIFDLLALMFSKYGAFIICVLSVLALIRFIAVMSTFPGSYCFYPRQLQVEFNRDYCQRMNMTTERLIKNLHTDIENGKMSSNKSRLSFVQLTQLIDNLYVFKHLVDQNI